MSDVSEPGKRVFTTGTFDLFHVGHLRFLQRARELAGYGGSLTVYVSTDEWCLARKGYRPVFPFKDRLEIVRSLKCVDFVGEERDNDCELRAKWISDGKFDIHVMGDDHAGHFDYLSQICRVVYLPRTEGVSTTGIIHDIFDTRIRDRLRFVDDLSGLSSGLKRDIEESASLVERRKAVLDFINGMDTPRKA